MALYQKVPVPRARRLDSTSSAGHVGPLQPHDFSSDSSDDSLSSSLLDAKQAANRSKHQRNYHHINTTINVVSSPTPPKPDTSPRFTITRRTLNTPTNTAAKHHKTISRPISDPILHETESENLCIPPPPPYTTPTRQQPANVRQYTPSSDPSTLPSVVSTVQPPSAMPLMHPPTAQSVRANEYNDNDGDKDRLKWNYAYSYASSTMAPQSRYDGDEHKTIDSPRNKLTHRPVLTTELQPILQEMKISETSQHTRKASLYTGFVTPNPIEIHNELMRQPKLPGPLLIYRTLFTDDMDRISDEEFIRKSTKTKKELGYIPIFALPIQSITLSADICLQTALCEMKIVFINNCGKAIKDALFILPMIHGSVRNISVCIQNNKSRENLSKDGKRYIETFLTHSDIMDNNDIDDANDIASHMYDGIFKRPLDEYIAGLFRVPIEWIGSHDAVEITAQWEQTLQYKDGRYHLTVPLQFAHNILPNNVNLSEIIHINIVLNTFLSSIKFGSNSHNLSISQTLHESKQTHICAVPSEHDIQSKDFHIAYYVDTNKVAGSAFIATDIERKDAGHFVLYINPNTDHKYNAYDVFGRDIIFLIDRSASMTGSYSKVLQGLTSALDMLHHKDKFGIVCFNETQIYFHGRKEPHTPKAPQVDLNAMIMNHKENKKKTKKKTSSEQAVNDLMAPKAPLFPASKEYIDCAKQFVVNYGAEGGTDIVTPLRWALNILNNGCKQHRTSCNGMGNIAYIVLITDGCDYQEKEILNDIHLGLCCKNVRILTFGIGKYCNAYFLSLLAMKSRGWNDHVMYGSDIKNGIESLMQKCQAPVLRDLCIEDDVTKNEEIDLYPFDGVLPDLYIDGAPIIVCGRYRNDELPQILMETNHTIRISGVAVDGEPKIYEFNVNYDETHNYFSIPINQICVKKNINALAAKLWLNKNEANIKQMIVDLCMKHNICSEYVSMICCECKDKNEKYNLNINELLSIHRNITKIGVTNQYCGDLEINHNICGILKSIGELINDDIQNSTACCCCCCL